MLGPEDGFGGGGIGCFEGDFLGEGVGRGKEEVELFFAESCWGTHVRGVNKISRGGRRGGGVTRVGTSRQKKKKENKALQKMRRIGFEFLMRVRFHHPLVCVRKT